MCFSVLNKRKIQCACLGTIFNFIHENNYYYSKLTYDYNQWNYVSPNVTLKIEINFKHFF
jgi:hypothetical protein